MSSYHISLFNSDTGNRDLGSEESFPRENPEHVIIEQAIKFARMHGNNSVVVVRTKPYGSKPGAWYIKGYKDPFHHEDLRSRIETNVRLGLYSRRECWLIRLNK